jgi:shikimate dehydrogenase
VPRTRLGVIGWPVAHSRSPAFQNAALAATGLAAAGWRYQRLPVPPALLAETVPALPAAGFRGINVTIPHKEAALALAELPTARAAAIGAANTLLFEPGGVIRADNTDAPGLIASLPEPPRGQTALVLGAGGSARAAVWALLDAGAAEVRVWNRDPRRAEKLCAELGGVPVRTAEPADLLVHCTPVGLGDEHPGLKGLPLDTDHLSRYKTLVDFAYRGGGTALVRAGRRLSLPTVDGLELLIAQGALSFEQFTGLVAPVATMRNAVGL